MDERKKWCDEVADLCWTCYNELETTGKPNHESEYTVLAAIVLENKTLKDKNVAALTTGTKCVTKDIASHTIIDCHAESLLKRAFKRHLISRVKHGLELDNLVITLFVSQVPCGVVQRWKGADAANSLENYAAKGVHRKPGRGNRCQKPSCINKIAKWNVMGIQGNSLVAFTNVLRVENILIGNCGSDGEFDGRRLEDAIRFVGNCSLRSPLFDLNGVPNVMFCESFRYDMFVRDDTRNQASPTAIAMWLEGNGQIVTEVVVDGRKRGVTKKNASRHQLSISDYHINEDIEDIEPLHSVPNNDFRDNYRSQWEALRNCLMFEGWTDSRAVSHTVSRTHSHTDSSHFS